jgi:hypothetical protein
MQGEPPSDIITWATNWQKGASAMAAGKLNSIEPISVRMRLSYAGLTAATLAVARPPLESLAPVLVDHRAPLNWFVNAASAAQRLPRNARREIFAHILAERLVRKRLHRGSSRFSAEKVPQNGAKFNR